MTDDTDTAPTLGTIAQAIRDHFAGLHGDMQDTDDIGEVIFDGVIDLEELAADITTRIGLDRKRPPARAIEFTPAAERVIARLHRAVAPFAEFAKTLTQWHAGNGPIKEAWPHHVPVVSGSYPITTEMNAVAQLYADDFRALAIVADELRVILGRAGV